jgi:hypothetical protein
VDTFHEKSADAAKISDKRLSSKPLIIKIM